jgi:glycosyltransferase involved in cell wall biosynthesis
MEPRVLQAIVGDSIGGTERFFERLVLALHRDGIQQLVMLRDIPSRMDLLRTAGLHPVAMRFEGLDLLVRRRVKAYVRSFQPGVALAWTPTVPRYLTKMGVPVIGRWGVGKPIDALRSCQHLLVHSADEWQALVNRGWSRERVHILPPLVDQTPLDPLPRKALFTPQQAPLLLCAGQMHVRRDIGTVLRIMQRLPEVYLWVAGDGPERDTLETMAYELGIKPRVRFLGWREDLGALYAASDLVVCSGSEGVPDHAALEAWAHGKPVVAIGSISKTSVMRADENTFALAADDILTATKAIKWTLSEPGVLDTLITRGQEAFAQGYMADQVLARYRGLFAHVAESG